MKEAQNGELTQSNNVEFNNITKSTPKKRSATFASIYGESLNKAKKAKVSDVGKPDSAKKTRKSRVNVGSIISFYKREDISRLVPQKRYATKDGPGFLMLIPVDSAHAKYNAENPDKKVSLGKFASLRPKTVRKLNRSHREYCVCPYCIKI